MIATERQHRHVQFAAGREGLVVFGILREGRELVKG
jgi:hypothetical protein